MTPFWFIVIGAGFGWLINSGRLQALIQATLQLPSTVANSTAGPCKPGEHLGPRDENNVAICVPD